MYQLLVMHTGDLFKKFLKFILILTVYLYSMACATFREFDGQQISFPGMNIWSRGFTPPFS